LVGRGGDDGFEADAVAESVLIGGNDEAMLNQYRVIFAQY
jgi:hypothetical protein